ncbi:MAG TPA: diguanylate cyclase [Desulfomicrobiaceae bacterium]|nr:diguanylate cyclase [Desulfomicrobiaceae bacterium]
MTNELSDAFYKTLLENLYDGVYYVDLEQRITFWNAAAERITGFSAAEVVGKKCSNNILRHVNAQGTELCVHGCPLHGTLEDGKDREIEVYLHHKKGFRVPVSVRITPIRDSAGQIIGAVEIFTDQSRRSEIIRELEVLKQEVYLDGLTAIGNRKFATMNLQTRMFEFKTMDIPFGVLFFDIDRFKSVNDTYGHDVGDEVLKMVAQSAANGVRKLDALCRWGGEEFLAIIPNVSQAKLMKIAERVRVLVEQSWIAAPDSPELGVTVSIGATLARPDDSIESVVKRADQLMYASKQSGRNRVTAG